jgi:23S rRNA pseudouridine2604 synthase
MERPILKLPKRKKPPEDAKKPHGKTRKPHSGAQKPRTEAHKTRSEAQKPRTEAQKPRTEAHKPRSETPRPHGDPPRPRSEAPRPRSEAPAPQPQFKPRPAPLPENPDGPRLSKRMSELGLCSRREADEWIENGWVKVDGNVVNTLGARVSRDAKIEIDPEAARHQSEQVTILLNKPMGYVSGQPEHGYEPAMVLIKPENRWPEDPSTTKFRAGHLRNLAPAGRLDIDSTGLIVFTQDGRVAKRLIGSDSDVEKEYLVRVEGTLTEDGMKLLHHGLELDGVKLKPARVSWANEDQLRFVLREGRKRQIRRMCELVGLTVTALKRVRTGGVPLGKLPVGQWRYLRRDEKF